MKFHWPLYSDIIFFVDHFSAGVSNKQGLLPFFHWYCFITQHAYIYTVVSVLLGAVVEVGVGLNPTIAK